MNKKMIAAVSVIIAIGLKQYLNLDITESAIESLIEIIVQIVAAVIAGKEDPKEV